MGQLTQLAFLIANLLGGVIGDAAVAPAVSNTNLLLHSTDCTNAAWTTNNCNVALDVSGIVAPDGSTPFVLTGTGANPSISQAIVISAGFDGVFSFYILQNPDPVLNPTQADLASISIALSGGAGAGGGIVFNTTTGKFTAAQPNNFTMKSDAVIVNGLTWFRISWARVNTNNTLATVTIGADQTSLNKFSVVACAQFEAGTVPGPYIPTTNTAVTRSAGKIPRTELKVAIQSFTATGANTYNKPAGHVASIAIAIGGGGGSGGAAAGDGSPGASGANACISVLQSATIAATEVVTVGTGGTAGTTVTAGGNGVDSSFGAHVVAKGGIGGPRSITAGHIGAIATTVGAVGQIILSGSDGDNSMWNSTQFSGGNGGNSPMGGGGKGRGADTTQGVAEAGNNFGGGAGGSMGIAAAQAGAAGAQGAVFVIDFCQI
jgi:hypothetical protein